MLCPAGAGEAGSRAGGVWDPSGGESGKGEPGVWGRAVGSRPGGGEGPPGPGPWWWWWDHTELILASLTLTCVPARSQGIRGTAAEQHLRWASVL